MADFAYVLKRLIGYLQLLIFFRAIVSFVIRDFSNPIMRFLYFVTEPIIRPIREILPRSSMGLDFSPMLAYILLEILEKML